MVFLQKIFEGFCKSYKGSSTKHVKQINGASYYASTTSQEYEENINVALKRLQHSHLNTFIFLYLNIISIRNRFGDLDKMVDGNIDILCIAETKLDESFSKNRFVYQYNQFIYTG